MKLALILGKKQGENIKPRLQSIKDNLNIDVFEDVAEFVYNVSKRNTIYDRILVLSTKITPSTLKDLNTCWGMYSKETSVVMLSRSGVDEEKAMQFLNTFKTPVACAMLVSSTTVQIIAESVLRPVIELNNEYGIKDFLHAEVEEDEYQPEPVVTQTAPVITQSVGQQQTVQQPQQRKPAKKKHGGFFSSIFGSRVVDDDESTEEISQSQSVEQIEQPITQVDQPVQEQFVASEQEFPAAPESASDSIPIDEQTLQVVATPEQFSPVDESEQYQPMQPKQAPQMSPVQSSFENSPIQNFNVPTAAPSSLVNVSFDETLIEEPQEIDDFAPEPDIADVDFGATGTMPAPSSSLPQQPSVFAAPVEQADENFGDVNIAGAETQYRAQTEAPKVITRTVKEPVLGSGSVLKSVYAGRLSKVLIVTGDRGSGVTSTALNIAQTIAKHVHVLYFDCDIDNHGLLNYIDYVNFKNYEKMHMEGVKMCRSSQVFNKCVISWEENLDLLTSDFSCDCTLEELQSSAEIVAERAGDYGVVVVDCPANKLSCISDLVLIGQSIICVEGTKRGFMNMLCQLEASSLATRYKRNLESKGTMFVTKCTPRLDLKKLLQYVKAVYQPSEVDWLSPKPVPFNGKLNEVLLNEVLGG